MCILLGHVIVTSFNTQPPEGGCPRHQLVKADGGEVSTHSRPKAAAASVIELESEPLFQHTAARRRLRCLSPHCFANRMFQHTAARRRLPPAAATPAAATPVSTHSRPKAAACADRGCRPKNRGFNTQPPEGGCPVGDRLTVWHWMFQHTAARRRLPFLFCLCSFYLEFQHTAARRRLLQNHRLSNQIS